MTTFENEVERIVDVLAVRAAMADGEPGEIHVLAAPGRDAQEIAGDVRSLAALNGIDLAAEAVHVVQLQAAAPAEEQTSVIAVPEPDADDIAEPVATGRTRRIQIDGVVVVSGERMARAITTVRRDNSAATGTAVFVPAEAAARRGVAEATVGAVLEIIDSHDDMAVDAAIVVSVPPHQLAIVTIAVVGAHGEVTLVGAVRVRSAGVNDAIARAVLDALNRWFDVHG